MAAAGAGCWVEGAGRGGLAEPLRQHTGPVSHVLRNSSGVPVVCTEQKAASGR